MDEKKFLKILWYILLASMSVLTVLFFFDIIASFRIHDKKGGEDKGRRARRRTQAG